MTQIVLKEWKGDVWWVASGKENYSLSLSWTLQKDASFLHWLWMKEQLAPVDACSRGAVMTSVSLRVIPPLGKTASPVESLKCWTKFCLSVHSGLLVGRHGDRVTRAQDVLGSCQWRIRWGEHIGQWKPLALDVSLTPMKEKEREIGLGKWSVDWCRFYILAKPTGNFRAKIACWRSPTSEQKCPGPGILAVLIDWPVQKDCGPISRLWRIPNS